MYVKIQIPNLKRNKLDSLSLLIFSNGLLIRYQNINFKNSAKIEIIIIKLERKLILI